MLTEVLHSDPYTSLPEEGNFWDGFPIPATPTTRVLHPIEDHSKDVVAKALLSKRNLSKVADARRGLEVGVLNMTRVAVITNLLWLRVYARLLTS